MINRADVVGFDAQGDVVLVADVKARYGASRTWAAQFRRNLLSHGLVRNARFFLIALPDRFYLWTGAPSDQTELPPTYDVDPSPFLEPYFRAAGIPPDRITGNAFELMLASWLNSLTRMEDPPASLKEQSWLFESGLLDALRGGSIAYGVAA
jgi:hypothetical protein